MVGKLLIDCGHETNTAIGRQWMNPGAKYTLRISSALLVLFYGCEWFVHYHVLKLLGRSAHVYLRSCVL
jgi:hypothetical protein